MISNIINTFSSRIGIAAISFFSLLLNARFLGSEGVGTIGIIVLGITIFQLLSNLLNGSIIYLSSKVNQSTLLLLCYLWSFLCLGLFWGINSIYPVFDESYRLEIYLLSLLQSVIAIHFFVLIGNEKIKLYNALSLTQSVVTIGMLLIYYFMLGVKTVDAFIHSLFIAYGFTFVLSLLLSYRLLPKPNLKVLGETFSRAIKYGAYIQLANTFQLMNYRISYYVLDAFSGRSALGLYVGGVRLSEALILPGRSIATVQYARISNSNRLSYAQRISFFFMKISFAITSLGLLILLALPQTVYTFLLGEDYNGVKPIIVIMALGIVLQSAEIILSHYFSGTGQQKWNTYSAFVGMTVTLIAGFSLIPSMGAMGAALTSSLSYASMFLFLGILMSRQKGVQLSSFFPSKRDFRLVKRLMKRT